MNLNWCCSWGENWLCPGKLSIGMLHVVIFRPAPQQHTSRGLWKTIVTTTIGLYIGASISQRMAAFLEENELFVPEDDDNDDD